MIKKAILLIPLCICCLLGTGCSFTQNEQTDEAAIQTSQPIYEPEILFSSEIVSQENGKEFFVDYRIQREQFREHSKEMLKVLVESDIQENRIEAQKRWLELTDQIARETEIENTLKVKGYEDAVSKVIDNNVSVMIYAKEISPEERTRIQKTIAEIADTYYKNVEISNIF